MQLGIPTAVLLLGLLAGPASAQTTHADPCANAMTTLDMDTCLGAALRQADSTLNRYYSEARRLATAPTSLRKAELEWIQYRDIDCAAEAAEYEGGSIQSSVVGTCKLSLTQARTHELWAVYLQNSRSELPEPRF